MSPMPTFRKAADMAAEPTAPAARPSNIRANKYGGKCVNCDAFVPEGAGTIDKVDGKWVVKHIEPCPSAEAAAPVVAERQVNVVNGQPLYDGIYTYETLIAYRTFRLRTQEADDSFMPGVQIIQHLTGPDNSHDYTSIGHVVNGKPRIWKKHQDKQTLVKDVMDFFADPQAALTSATCFACHRTLTVPASIHAGLGPECAKKGF